MSCSNDECDRNTIAKRCEHYRTRCLAAEKQLEEIAAQHAAEKAELKESVAETILLLTAQLEAREAELVRRKDLQTELDSVRQLNKRFLAEIQRLSKVTEALEEHIRQQDKRLAEDNTDANVEMQLLRQNLDRAVAQNQVYHVALKVSQQHCHELEGQLPRSRRKK